MDFLTGEINKLKRKAPADAESKYVRRGDLEAQRLEKYRDDQLRRQKARESREAEKLERIAQYEEAKQRKIVSRTVKEAEKTDLDLPSIQKELRNLHEPILLFGEEASEVMARLRQAKAKHDRLLNSTQALLDEVYVDPPDNTLPVEGDIELDASWAKSKDSEDNRRLHQNLYLFLRLYVSQWCTAVYNSTFGEGEQELYGRAREHLAPLLMRLKAVSLPTDILTNLSNVATGLRKRDYTAANHAYLQMSIGKATWPVGVTMVGIHERAQRERVNKVMDSAHILADESTRQWLQSLKRLITHREKHYRVE